MNTTDVKRIETYFDRLWPINRSITGPGIRASLDIISEIAPMQRLRFESGAEIFDWTVPLEWHCKEAYFIDPTGKKHADFKQNNLHLVGYSRPYKGTLSLDELTPHLHMVPDQPKAIPYLTSYYSPGWGFCLTREDLESLPNGDYQILIDANHYPGHVEIGEAMIEGEMSDEILFSTYLCHPSMANNELSGPLATVMLYERIAKRKPTRFTYRFAFTAETIGTLCYLHERGNHLRTNMVAGYQLTCVGDRGDFTYKTSRRGDTLSDRAAKLILRDRAQHSGESYQVVAFDPSNGSDERQYCSPGFDLPLGSLMRTMYGEFPQYHTSFDNKDFVSFDAMVETIDLYMTIVDAIENNRTWRSTAPFGEPQLGKRGLYPTMNDKCGLDEAVAAMMWLLNLADGEHDLLSIAEISGHRVSVLLALADQLQSSGLLNAID